MSLTYTEIKSAARRFVGDKDEAYEDSDILASANAAMDRITNLIRAAQGRWQWDDSNDSDFAIAFTDLEAEKADYDQDPTHYRVERYEVKGQDGNWRKLVPIDQADIFNQSLTDFLKTSGTPKYYDLVGNSIFLYPKASYDQEDSFKVYYNRGPSYFASNDTTKKPGFNDLFHKLVPLWAAYDYAFINQMPIQKQLFEQISLMEDQLAEYYSLRQIDEHPRLVTRMRKMSFK